MLSSPGSLAPSADGASLSRHLLDYTPPEPSSCSSSLRAKLCCQRFSCLGLLFFPFPSSPRHHTQEINPPVLGAFLSRKAGDTCLCVAWCLLATRALWGQACDASACLLHSVRVRASHAAQGKFSAPSVPSCSHQLGDGVLSYLLT